MDKEQYALMYQVEDSHWWYVGMRRITASLLARVRWRGSHARILDAGCGTGGTTAWLRAYGSVVGVDLAPEGLDLAQQRGLAALARASVQQLPFADESFDLVTSFDVLYHLDVQTDVECLREFARVLRPGGCALIRLPAYDWLRSRHDRAVHTRHRYTARELRGKLTVAGLVPLRLTYANSLLFPAATAKRLAEAVTAGPGDLEQPGRLARTVFGGALALEARILAHVALPFGLSVVGLARKPSALVNLAPKTLGNRVGG